MDYEGRKVFDQQFFVESFIVVKGIFVDMLFYKLVNIVFVLDVLEFMKVCEKLELLKFVMNELVEEFRDVDWVMVLIYGDKVELYILMIFVFEKMEIKSCIMNFQVIG